MGFEKRSTCQLSGGLMAAVAVTLLLAMLTGCDREPRTLAAGNQEYVAQVSLFNATHDVLPLRFQSLRWQYAVDCELVAADPELFLREEHLTHRLQRLTLSGHEISFFDQGDVPDPAVSGGGDCLFTFMSLTDDRLPSIALSWPRSLAQKTFYSDVDAPADLPPEAPVLIAEADYSSTRSADMNPWRHRPCGGSLSSCDEEEYEEALQPTPGAQYHWSILGEQLTSQPWESSSIAVMEVEDPLEEPQCVTGRGSTALSWDRSPAGRWQVLGVEERAALGSGDSDAEEVEPNCYDVSLQQATSMTPGTWSFCGSQRLSLRLSPEGLRGKLMVEFFTEEQYGAPPAAYENLTIDIRRETEEGDPFEVETIELVRGHGVPDHMGLDWEPLLSTNCEARREIAECNQIILPTGLKLVTATGDLEIRPSETVALDPTAERRLELIRGMHRAVIDKNCHDERTGSYQLSHPGAYLEFIYYAGVTVVAD